MKIRTDFVTNSSSSSFITIVLELNGGEKIEGNVSLETGYGSNFVWDESVETHLTPDLNNAQNGKDVLKILEEEVSDYLEAWLKKEHSDDFYASVATLQRSDLKGLKISESLRYDADPGSVEREYKYSFGIKAATEYYKKVEGNEDDPEEEYGINISFEETTNTATIPYFIDEVSDIDLIQDIYDTETCEYIIVEDSNPTYSSINGSLYSRGGDKLILATISQEEYKRDIYITPIVKIIGQLSFCLAEYLPTHVVVADGVEEIEDKAFYFCEDITILTIPNSIKKIGKKILPPLWEGKLECHEGSYAQRYAEENSISVQII